MSEETKMILKQLGEINENVREMKADIAELKSDVAVLKSDVAVLKSDVAVLKSEVAELKSDVAVLKSDVAELKDEMREVKGRIVKLELAQRDTQLQIENEISKKINIVADGHFFVLKELNALRSFQEDKEKMDLRIMDLQIEVKKIKRYLMIA